MIFKRTSLLSFQSWSTRRKVLFAVKSTAVATSITTFAYFWPEIKFTGATINRTTRTAKTLFSCMLDYKRHYPFEADQKLKDDVLDEDELDQRRGQRSLVHQRTAEKLLSLFQTNGGIYIKLGQHMASLEHILPLEYSTTMSVLQDQAPQSSMADVAAVIREDLKGKSLDQLFIEFDEVPLGAASLAQVHRARLVSGEEVAVKIQHHRLQAFVDMDMFTVSVAVKLVKRIFPQFEFGWLADEMRTNLPKELDFISEAHNSERVRRNLERSWSINCPIHVPQIRWELTTRRVLVMEYCPGAKVTDVIWMKSNGLNPRRISEMITRLYSQMIFLHGFVHCDPHPGNIFVRKIGNEAQIILLDHGLYKELPDSFRLTYANLWKSLIDGNEQMIEKYATELGCADTYKLFSTVVTHRSWESMTSSRDWHKQRDPADVKRFREKASDYLPMLADLLSKVPRPLLLLLKTNDLLRSIDRTLHADTPTIPSATFLIMGGYCIKALNDDRMVKSRGNLWLEFKSLMTNFIASISYSIKWALFDVYKVFAIVKLI